MKNILAEWPAVSFELPSGQGSRLERISSGVGEDHFAVTFDDSANEQAIVTLPRLPDSYQGGSMSLVVTYVPPGSTSGNSAPFLVAVEALTPGTDGINALGDFDTGNTMFLSGHSSSNQVRTGGSSLTNADSAATGDRIRIKITRNISGGGNTLSGDIKILGVTLYEEITEHEISLPINSSVATGTAPFTIASTTVCTNLNADLLDGQHESAFALLAGRSGGQTYNGGTASGEHLRLYASAHATQGNTYLHKGNTTYVRGSDAFMVIKDNTFFGDRSCEIWSGGAPRIVFTGASGFGYLQLYDASAVVQITIDGSNGFMAGKVVGVTGSNGQSALIRSLTELTTIATATTTDTTIQLPAGALILGVSARVTTAIPTATLVNSLTGATSGTTFSTGTFSTAATTTNRGTAAGCFYNANAQAVRITLNGTPAANTGRVRVTIHYIEITPPTS